MNRLISFIGMMGTLVQAKMVFENPVVEMTAKPSDEVVLVEFPFKVVGEAVEIDHYDAPCTCLDARVEPTMADGAPKLSWKPGESGKIVGKFKIGTIKGTVIKSIIIHLKERDEAHKLEVKMTVPVLLSIDPPTHKWALDGESEEKVFTLKVNGEKPMKILECTGTNADFPFELKTVTEGREYQILVNPRDLSVPSFGLIRVKTDSDIPKYRNKQMFVLIQKPRE